MIIEARRPPTEWPMGGEIKFEDYSTRYREGLDLVVRNISLSIKAGEKVLVFFRLTSMLFKFCCRVFLLNLDSDQNFIARIDLFYICYCLGYALL